ncbi:MAG: hypothetical protein R3Y05_05085 [bacterium]
MINEILKLDVSNDSIVKIGKYLNKTDINDENHAIAVSHLLSLYAETKQIKEILNIVDTYTKRYSNDNSIIILDKLIELTLEDNKEECLKAINQKKELLDSFDLIHYYKDMINFNKDNLEERIRYINLYLQDDTSKTNRLNGMYLLAKAYIDNDQFDKFNKNLEITKELALELGKIEIFESLVFFEASSLYNKQNYEAALEIINESTVRSEHFGNLTNLLKFKIYFQQGKYRQCIILEGKCEELMQTATKDIQREFYKLCVELYELTNNKISVDLYKNKLIELEYKKIVNTLDSSIEETIKPIKIKKEKKVEVKVDAPTFKNFKKAKPSLNEMSDFYQETTFIYQPFYTPNLFREQLRLSLVKLNEQVNFNDCYIVTKDESFHFKKERLYDKKDVDLKVLDSFHNVNTEIISFNTQSDNITNPFTNEILEYNTTTIFPLFKEKCFGAIYFASADDDMISGKLNYEKLHSFAKFYNSVALLNYDKEDVIRDNKAKTEILEAKAFYYGYIENDYFYCEKETKQFLGTTNRTTLNSFFSIICTQDYYEFQKNFNEINVNESIEQLAKLTNDKKVLFKITRNSEYKYLLIFEDYTQIEEKKESLIVTAYHNPITKLKNNEYLNIEIDKYFDMKKFSAVLINFKDLKKYTYLYQEKFSLDILKFIGKVLPEFNKDYDYYHLNFDKLIVLIKDVNDKRVLKQIITKIDKYLIEQLSSINTRLIPKFTYGTYRSFVDTKEKTVKKMLEILSDSILNVDDLYDEFIGFYDIDLYKQRFMKEQLVTYISEAIDSSSIKVLYSQCISIKENLVEYYEAKLNLNQYTVEDGLLEEVIKRRNLTTTLEQYLINRTFHEMNLIYEKTDYSINVVIHLDEYSLIKKSLVNYLEEKVKQYKITSQRVIFKVNKIYPAAIDNIALLVQKGFRFALNDIEDLSLLKPHYFLLNNFKNTNIFNDEYIKSLVNIFDKQNVKFVLTNTKKNEEIEHYKEIINYFIGDVYKEKLSYLDITNFFTTGI